VGGKARKLVGKRDERSKEGRGREWVEVMQNFCTVVNVL
jgi:hypothetical protein